MAHYSKTHRPDKLKVNDTVEIYGIKHTVEEDHLCAIGEINHKAFVKAGLNTEAQKMDFFKAVSNVKPSSGYWPETNLLAAHAAVVNALLDIEQGLRTVDDFMKPKYDAKTQKIVDALAAGNWGCQKDGVYKLVSAIIGQDIKP